MDPLIIILTIVVCVLAIVFVVVGVQLILVLQEVKNSLKKANILIETVEKATNQVAAPLMGLGGTLEGMKSGLKVAQAFVNWLNKNNNE